jgi:carbamoyltransferase
MLILGVHPGLHDASAAVFDDYRLIAAVQLERLTRIKCDGLGVPWQSVDEVLDIAGASRRDVDVVAMGRMALPVKYFKHFRGIAMAARAISDADRRRRHTRHGA